MECRKCTYFDKKKNLMNGGTVIVGYCRLREKHISDETIVQPLCKDRAVVDISPERIQKNKTINNEDLETKAWMTKPIEKDGMVTA